MAYCTPEDLILDKSIPVPAGSDLTNYINIASAHIDTELRGRYATPIVVDQSRLGHDQDKALLRNIAAHLATGYFILAITSGRELAKIHDYGNWLISRAQEWLTQLRDGSLALITADTGGADAPLPMDGAPLISQGISHSLVDSYYQNFEPYGFTPDLPHRGRSGEVWPYSAGHVAESYR